MRIIITSVLLLNSSTITQCLIQKSDKVSSFKSSQQSVLYFKTDEIHTTLVNIYLDQILSKSHDQDEHTRFARHPPSSIGLIFLYHRSKLQEFLIKSDCYRIQSVLNRINQTNQLKREVALLHGKVYLPEKFFLQSMYLKHLDEQF